MNTQNQKETYLRRLHELMTSNEKKIKRLEKEIDRLNNSIRKDVVVLVLVLLAYVFLMVALL